MGWFRSRRRRIKPRKPFDDLERVETDYDLFLIFKKNGLGYIYFIPDGWCGPWCCFQTPRNRKNRKKLWNQASGWSKRKTLRTHRKPWSKK